MKKKENQNKRGINHAINPRVNQRFKSLVQGVQKSSVQEIIVATENMMAMPKSIILKIKERVKDAITYAK